MRIWHQSFTVLDDVPHYRDALAHHLGAHTEGSTTVDLHGLRPGTFPSVYPGTHMGYAYLTGLHKEQFVQAALHAQDEGYDAFFIATLLDTAYEELRTIVDIPVVALGHTSVLMATMLGERVRIRELQRCPRAAPAAEPPRLPPGGRGRAHRPGRG